VVSHSFPWSANGYAIRVHQMARALIALGHEVIVFNRPGRPWDIEGFPAGNRVETEQRIDGVRYVFLPSTAAPTLRLRERLRHAERVLMQAFEVFRPGVVLAAPNWENGEPAQYAARRWGCDFYYEQHGFWELSPGAEAPGFADSEEAKRDRQSEVRIAQAAAAVIVQSSAMRRELTRLGVAAERIHMVPNGVAEAPRLGRGLTRAAIGCTTRHLLGYIGSLAAHEGVADLLDLVARLRRDGVDAGLLIVGSGTPAGLVAAAGSGPEDRLRQRAAELGIAGQVIIADRVPEDRAGAYYSLLDAAVLPRRRVPATELAAPLSPYAAAAWGVPVFMTDMPPLDEIAGDVHASLFPEGDMDTLAAMLRETLEKGGHAAATTPLKPNVYWVQRARAISRLLRASAAALPAPAAQMRIAGGTDGDDGRAVATGSGLRFDTHILPPVALRGQLGTGTLAALGPCAGLRGRSRVIDLTRVNILAELATAEPGAFVIDWAGLQAGLRSGDGGEWDGLWSIGNMRLNRQVMDACRIALDRGWKLQVLGPVLRSRAPLFRTVAAVLEEVVPDDLSPGPFPGPGPSADPAPQEAPQ
jgi:glycosyltransferase involved in cell wall biosynthesis